MNSFIHTQTHKYFFFLSRKKSRKIHYFNCILTARYVVRKKEGEGEEEEKDENKNLLINIKCVFI